MSDQPIENPATTEQEKGQPAFALQKIFVRDMSFEAPGALENYQDWKPKVEQDLNTEVNKIGDNLYEVVLKLTVTVKPSEEKTAFLTEVHQAGVFYVDGLEGVQLQHVLTSAAPQILFPYAREAIDNMTIRGGFPPLMLPPINFDAIFAKAVNDAQEKAKAVQESGEAEATH